jgi:enoyl-CoA hydratase/carnithine racemase
VHAIVGKIDSHDSLDGRDLERLELVKNTDYWNKDRIPKVDRLVLLPMPEANARTAALLSGQVDWVENPAPDAIPQIKQIAKPLGLTVELGNAGKKADDAAIQVLALSDEAFGSADCREGVRAFFAKEPPRFTHS